MKSRKGLDYKMMQIKKFFLMMKFMFTYSWHMSKKIFFTTAIEIILNTIEPLLIVILPKYIIDELSGLKRWEYVKRYTLIFVAFLITIKGVRMITDVMINSVYNKIQSKTGQEYFYDYLKMDYERLEDKNFRDLSAKIKYNVRCSNFIGTDMSELITSVLRLFGFSYIIFTSSNIIILAAILLATIAGYFISIKRETWNYSMQGPIAASLRKFEYLYNVMLDFSFAKEIRINKAFNLILKKYDDQENQYKEVIKKDKMRNCFFDFLQYLVNFFRDAVIYTYAVFLITMKKMTIGSFTMYVASTIQISDAFLSVVKKVNYFRVFVNNISEYKQYKWLATPNYLKRKTNIIDTSGDIVIEYDHVFFKYPNTECYILKDLSLRINPMEKLGVVGLNGCGKSTFIKLLCKLYEPTKGRILINGIDINTIDNEQYISLISVIFQDFQVFSFSILDNIILANKYDEHKFRYVTEMSDLSDKIDALDKKEHTMISKEFDEGGIEFSGGESQKLALARALYRDSKIIILDEPTAALDPIAEYNLYNKFNRIVKNKTAIFISHRLSSTRFCDKIAVFENGSVKEYGSHDELLQANGLYSEMFHTQASPYIAKEEG